MMQSDDALRLITVLRGRGFTVEISGAGDCYLSVTHEILETVFGQTTEEAVLMVARKVYDNHIETTEALKLYLDKYPSPPTNGA